jgi:hypothetical protein
MKKGEENKFKDLQSIYEIILVTGEGREAYVGEIMETIDVLFPELSTLEKAILGIKTITIIEIMNREEVIL